jgi:hypothetical protein
MNVEDFHKRLKELYLPPPGQFTLVDVPEISFLVIDGKGDPRNQAADAVKWLYSVVHLIKPLVKKRMGKNFVEPPLECLCWAKREKDFVSRNRDKLLWRMMVVFIEEWIPDATLSDAIVKVERKLGPAPKTLRLETMNEGKSVQIMHIGDYEGVAKVCDELYAKFLPQNDLRPKGYYHEIYLNDPARTAPDKRKIVIRQPVE